MEYYVLMEYWASQSACRGADCFSPVAQDQSGQHSETLSKNQKKTNKKGILSKNKNKQKSPNIQRCLDKILEKIQTSRRRRHIGLQTDMTRKGLH
jgi:hypothetical protein